MSHPSLRLRTVSTKEMRIFSGDQSAKSGYAAPKD
jgi:hypothetical protein